MAASVAIVLLWVCSEMVFAQTDARTSNMKHEAQDVTNAFVAAHNKFATNHKLPEFHYDRTQARIAMGWCARRKASNCDIVYEEENSLSIALFPSKVAADDVVQLWYNQIHNYDFAKTVDDNVRSIGSCGREISNFLQIAADYPSRGLGCCETDCGESSGRHIYVCKYHVGAGSWRQSLGPGNSRSFFFYSLVGNSKLQKPVTDLSTPSESTLGISGCVANIAGHGPEQQQMGWHYYCDRSCIGDAQSFQLGQWRTAKRARNLYVEPVTAVDISCEDTVHSLSIFTTTGDKQAHFRCPGLCTQSMSSVWGTYTYKDDSSLCKAAIHGGIIPENGGGGEVEVRLVDGGYTYTGTNQHGVTSKSFGAWPRGFTVSRLPRAATVGTCSGYTESYTRDMRSAWRTDDPVPAVNGPSSWSIAPNWMGRKHVVQQQSAVKGGGASGDAQRGTFLLLNDYSCNNGRVQADIMLSDDSLSGLVFRYIDAKNFYIFDVERETSFKRLRKMVNGWWTTLVKLQDAPLEAGVWRHVEVLFHKSQIEVKWDGRSVCSVDDPDLQDGTVGLSSWGTAAGTAFDNIRIDSDHFL